MNLNEEVYFELGKLNLHLKLAKKSFFLLPIIVRQGVMAINYGGKRIEFESVFSPNVAENPSKETMLIVKQIKLINDYCAKDSFNLECVKSIITAFDKKADLSAFNNIAWEGNLQTLHLILKLINKNQSPLTLLVSGVVANVFLVKAKLIDFPMLDITKSIIENNNDTIEDFNALMLNAIKSTINILQKHKNLIKADVKKAESAKMKSVILEYNYIIENPVVEVGSMLDDLEMTFATLSKATAILEELGILTKIAGSQRYRVFKYNELCKLFEE